MLSTEDINHVIREIISHQAMIMGPMAIEQASKVDGIKIQDSDKLDVVVKEGDPEIILTNLVKKYEELFGQASVEVCRDAIKELKLTIPPEDLPEIIR
jgi:hypothetical protein